jgi:hypothetical protein
MPVDHGYRESGTPHTQRHIRNIVLGWNIMHPEDPARVVELGCQALDGVWGALRLCGAVGTRHSAFPDEAPRQPCDMETTKRQLLADCILGGYAAEMTLRGKGKISATSIRSVIAFEEAVQDALDALEADWLQAEQDYWRNSRVIKAQYLRRDPTKGLVRRPITILVGFSKTVRFGAVSRLGNVEKRRRKKKGQSPRGRQALRDPKHRFRHKADVTIQFHDKGKFLVSTKGIPLDGVAAVLRQRDLASLGIYVANPAELRQVGHLAYQDPKGRTVQALYFAEYRTACGNKFRANPYARRVKLPSDEITNLVVAALSSPT